MDTVGPGGRRLGFVSTWLRREPELTWSGIPWQARAALAEQFELVNVDASPPWPLLAAARRLTWVRAGDHWAHPSRYTRIGMATIEVAARRAVRAAPEVDAYLTVGDLAPLDRPYWVYQDLTFDLLRHEMRRPGAAARIGPAFDGVSEAMFERLWIRQRSVFERAAGVLAMSEWLRRDLVERSGFDPARVHVVYAGATSVAPQDTARSGDWGGDRGDGRLLFVGRDFYRKGGDVVVAATRLLRARGRDVRLTVAGPPAWPLGEPPPAGVEFLGPQPPVAVAALLGRHDLFVMPSRFEAFGIAFVEALSSGLPCIGRDLMAMSELIHPGVNGALVPAGGPPADEPELLADLIGRCLDDDPLRDRVAADRPAVAARFSWPAVARRIAAVVAGSPS
jgi:glycosyltransferase involved in cell wall biosynthesis